MYSPTWFREERLEVLQDAIDRISFGTLVTRGDSQILASHLPMLVDRTRGPKGTLFGHMARGNSQWRESDEGAEGLAMFVGPDAYISPSWYKTRLETGKVVPTWNYIAVHVRGPVVFFDDSDRLASMVTKLTEHHEAYIKDPWRVGEAPPDYIEKELKSVVGFEIQIAGIEGKWKLSQNRSQADRDGARAGLEQRGMPYDSTVSKEMKAREEGPGS